MTTVALQPGRPTGHHHHQVDGYLSKAPHRLNARSHSPADNNTWKEGTMKSSKNAVVIRETVYDPEDEDDRNYVYVTVVLIRIENEEKWSSKTHNIFMLFVCSSPQVCSMFSAVQGRHLLRGKKQFYFSTNACMHVGCFSDGPVFVAYNKCVKISFDFHTVRGPPLLRVRFSGAVFSLLRQVQ